MAPSKSQSRFRLPVQQPPEQEETRRERFERIGAARMNRVLNSIRLLGNLASPHYEWEEADVQEMQKAILEELDRAFQPFQKKVQAATKPNFDFTREKETSH